MSFDPITTLASIRSELEEGWKKFDDVFASLEPRRWSKKFGKTWVYADMPYHLAYFDATAAKYLSYGPDVPASEQLQIRTMRELHEWNRREFAKRGPNHTVADSLEAMRESRDVVRQVIARMTDADLDRQTWTHLILGWVTARQVLQMVIVHNVAEYWKLWLRTGKRGPAPSPSAVHWRLNFMMNFMPATMNRELASKKPFTMVWNFEGPGGGSWTFSVKNGKCMVTESAAERPDLSITMKPENFHKLVAKMEPPPLLILKREMKIRGFTKMATFGRLFPEPKPDQIIETESGGMVG